MGLLSINNLLTGAMKRANIGRQVTAGIIVSKCNELLPSFLPDDGSDDARVISFVRGTICIQAASGFVCEHIKEYEAEYLEKVETELETRVVVNIKYRVGTPNDYDF